MHVSLQIAGSLDIYFGLISWQSWSSQAWNERRSRRKFIITFSTEIIRHAQRLSSIRAAFNILEIPHPRRPYMGILKDQGSTERALCLWWVGKGYQDFLCALCHRPLPCCRGTHPARHLLHVRLEIPVTDSLNHINCSRLERRQNASARKARARFGLLKDVQTAGMIGELLPSERN